MPLQVGADDDLEAVLDHEAAAGEVGLAQHLGEGVVAVVPEPTERPVARVLGIPDLLHRRAACGGRLSTVWLQRLHDSMVEDRHREGLGVAPADEVRHLVLQGDVQRQPLLHGLDQLAARLLHQLAPRHLARPLVVEHALDVQRDRTPLAVVPGDRLRLRIVEEEWRLALLAAPVERLA